MMRFIRRMIGASVLDVTTYEDVERDVSSTVQAGAVVLLSAVAAGIGARGFSDDVNLSPALVGALALVAWIAWALLTFEIGARLLPEPGTHVDVGQLMRTLGFASAPGLLRVAGVFPGLTMPTFVLSAVWMLATTVVAVRQALDFDSTGRAVAVCTIGWLLALAMVFGFGLFLSAPLS